MRAARISRAIALLVLLAGTTACVTPKHHLIDERQPRSLLIVPPLNETPEVAAPKQFLSTVTRPLAERGYYVFPVAVVQQMMIDNGLPTPMEMNQVPLARLREVFAPDAVMYVRIKQWGTRFQVVNARSQVTVECTILDAATGQTIWAGSETAIDDSNAGRSSSSNPLAALIGAVVGAVVTQVAASADDEHSRLLARRANDVLFGQRLAAGPYHPMRIAAPMPILRNDVVRTASTSSVTAPR